MMFILPILALAIPVLLTGMAAFYFKLNTGSFRLVLAFSAAYLFSLTIMHLLPEVYSIGNFKLAGLFIVIGFSLQLLLENMSAGLEHGHKHHHSEDCHHKSFPTGIIMGLFLHSFFEGLPVYDAGNRTFGLFMDSNANYELIIGLVIHNIPISFLFVALLKEHGVSRLKNSILLLMFSLMAPFGYLFSLLMHGNPIFAFDSYQGMTDALVIGIFLYISTAIVFETGDEHHYSISKIMSMVAGVVLAYLLS